MFYGKKERGAEPRGRESRKTRGGGPVLLRYDRYDGTYAFRRAVCGKLLRPRPRRNDGAYRVVAQEKTHLDLTIVLLFRFAIIDWKRRIYDLLRP